MPVPPRFPALFVLAGLVGDATRAAPVPAPELAEAQLRAINHRFIDSGLDASGDLMQALTGDDFLVTAHDGSWRERADFLGSLRCQPSPAGARYEDMRVRLFGSVALVQGVFAAANEDGKPAKLRFTDVHVWSGSSWRLVSVQNTPLKQGVVMQVQCASTPLCAPWTGQDPIGDDLAVLRTLNEAYVQAFREADVAWYDAHLAQDYNVVSGDGTFEDRAAALIDFAKPCFATGMASFPVDKVNIRRFDDVALVHAENAYRLKDGRTGVSRYTDIWHKRAGRWLCIAAHITVHKAPADARP